MTLDIKLSECECMQNGTTCLFTACQYGRLEIAQYMIEKGGKELLLMKGSDVVSAE